MKTVVIGVDAGGSRTRVIVADSEGSQLSTAEGGGAALLPGRSERTADAIAAMVGVALAGMDAEQTHVAALVAGVAGAGREEEKRALQRELVNRGLAEDIVVETDAAVALADAFGDGAGVLLIAGTGSIAYGRGPTGQMARCGGWGSYIGDEGSGAWIGRHALAIVAAAADGRERPTELSGAILTAAQVNEPEQLIPWAATADRAAVAALAPVVLATARSDARANALADLAAEELVLHVRTLTRLLFAEERAAVQVALSGGLLERGSVLRRKVEHRLKTATPGAVIRSEPVIAARGAARLARALLGSRS